nr:AsmA-like C-terminal region-containing protein [Marinicella sp. W31]MDC2878703.1 AsmA-like C-terminal region-containing protein [Marinicella sp. W31]
MHAEGLDSLELTNSTLGFTLDGQTSIVNDVNATLEWPVLTGTARFSGSAVIADRPTRVTLTAQNAAAMIAGRASAINLTIANDTANIRFDGMASSNRPYLLDGTFSLSTTQLQQLMTGLGVESTLLKNVETASLKGKVSQSAGSLRFSPVDITIDTARGNGVLDMTPPSADGPAEVSATMAFKEVSLFDAQSSLPAWINAFAPAAANGSENELPLARLDLRVSAGSVRLSDVTLRDVAASIIRSREQTSFDIADSRLDQGSLYAHVAVRDNGTASVRMNAENVRSDPLFKQLGFSVPLESDQFDLEMSYEAPSPLSDRRQEKLTGQFRFAGREGSLSWLDLGGILQSARSSDNFAFSPLRREPFKFVSVAGRGSLSGTTVHLESMEMETAQGKVRLAGDVDIDTGQIDALLTTWGEDADALPISCGSAATRLRHWPVGSTRRRNCLNEARPFHGVEGLGLGRIPDVINTGPATA